ncbi:aspartic proteinase-like protein 1 [Carex littledalei]|uniref:Aspartic proteinase-like protein 1 n=1 Tax=Carex littledalei TaxID=544730 RepID=A0A833VG53_9POAL|nr:aspartic proteinase-like protein 1 [Carex littledalei]
MASISLLASFLLSLTFLSSLSYASPFSLEIHNRFSDKVRHWAESRGHPGAWWPQHGTSEYYAALAHHDRALHNRRSLATTSPEELAFSDGNATYRLSSLGYLYYAFVKLGTPNVTFFVALDTGSDLFWVPCDCKQCAALTSPSYDVNFAFNTYNPSNSSTSETISCGSSSCDEVQSRTCSGSNGNCTYSVSYASANTSTSGYIVEDVIYLTTETNQPQTIQASILFGCGQTQTGTFLEGGAPDGLMGLSISNVSVPSILANKGYTYNSFSMCFAESGIGRINFGDVGNSDQSETPLNVNAQSDYYNISLTGFSVGNTSYTSSFSAIVDSGTSFTYFNDPMYTDIVTSFNSQVQETRSTELSAEESFEYCYYFSSGQTSASVPAIAFTTQGGSSFSVNDALFTISSPAGNTVGYCLAIVKSSSLNIIGENFLTGLRVVFNRETLVLGWQNFDCYNTSAPAPYAYDPEKTNQVKVLESGSPHLSTMSSLILLFLVTMLFM